VSLAQPNWESFYWQAFVEIIQFKSKGDSHRPSNSDAFLQLALTDYASRAAQTWQGSRSFLGSAPVNMRRIIAGQI
jgi:hypothetical protein